MPTPASLLRSRVAALAVKAGGDLDVVWKQLHSPVQAATTLREFLPILVEQYGPAAATLTAVWYDDARERNSVAGRFEATPVDLGASGAEALAGWGVAPLFQAEPDWTAARTMIQGGLQRRIANYSRQTVMTSSVADPQARGWMRVGGGNSCEFCLMLLGRGAVYTEASADFVAHDHDDCAAAPAWA